MNNAGICATASALNISINAVVRFLKNRPSMRNLITAGTGGNSAHR